MQKGIQSLRCARGSSGVALNQLCQGVVFRQEMTSQQRHSWFFEVFSPVFENASFPDRVLGQRPIHEARSGLCTTLQLSGTEGE
jgi:hypothetical protein